MVTRAADFSHLALTDKGYILGMGLGQIYVTPDIGLAMRFSDAGLEAMQRQVPCRRVSADSEGTLRMATKTHNEWFTS
jgi:hypothetical protein